MGPLLVTPRTNWYIVVATNYLTKWPEARAIPKDDAKKVAKFIYEEIICWHGCPQSILSDRGSHFRNRLIDELLAELSVTHYYSTPYHLQTNRLVEWFNKTLCSSLAQLIENVRDWDLLIALILFAYRTAKQASTCETPFYLVYGRKAKLPLHPSDSSDLLHGTIIQRIYEVEHDLQWAREEAVQQIQAAQNKQKAQYDQQTIATPCCAIGDKVLITMHK